MSHEEENDEKLVRDAINTFDWKQKLKDIFKDRWVAEEPPPHKDDF